MQQQNRNNNLQQQQVNVGHPNSQIKQQNQYHPNNSTSMEPSCKHAAVSSTNDRAPIKATTATNWIFYKKKNYLR